jgi:hypothetical protein
LPHFERGGQVNYMIAGAGCSVAGRPGVTAAARAGSTGRAPPPASAARARHGPWSATFRSQLKAPWAVCVSFTCFNAVREEMIIASRHSS